jgi:hypothetical protein
MIPLTPAAPLFDGPDVQEQPMASVYPGGLDSFSTTRTTGQVVQASTDNEHSDAINKIEAELGTAPSGSEATVAARFASVESVVARFAITTYGASTGASAATNSTAIAEAKAAAVAAGTGVIFVPGGTFNYDTDLELPAGIFLEGVHPAMSVLHYTGTGYGVLLGTGALGGVSTHLGSSIRNLRITGTSSGKAGIRIRGAARWALNNVWSQAFSKSTGGWAEGCGLLLHGASFLGKIDNCQFGGETPGTDGNFIGISAQKIVADGSDARGSAFNAITITGDTHVQGNQYGMVIGDPAVTETGPVVGVGSNMYGGSVEGNALGGIWNVSASSFVTYGVEFEVNGTFNIRQGSVSGNTNIPVASNILGGFQSIVGMTGPSIDLVRAQKTHWDGIYFYNAGGTLAGSIAVKLAVNVTFPRRGVNNYSNVETEVHNTSGAASTGLVGPGDGQKAVLAPTSRLITPSDLVLVAGRTYALRFTVEKDLVVTSIDFYVKVASATNDNVNVGIYDAALGKMVIVEGTAGKLNSTGLKSVSISNSCKAGAVYYAVLLCPSSAAPATLEAVSYFDANLMRMFGATAPQIEAFHTNDNPLPVTLTIQSGAIQFPALIVRGA